MVQRNNAPRLRVEEDTPRDVQSDAPTARAREATQQAAVSGNHSQRRAEPDAEARVSVAPASQEASGASGRGVAHALTSVRQWLTETFPGHENAVLFGFLGFVLAILIFIIGFWRTLFILLLVLVGVAIGQQFDGDPRIINAIRDLVRENRS